MKVRSSVKRICENCKIIRRRGVVRVICNNPATSSARAKRVQAIWPRLGRTGSAH